MSSHGPFIAAIAALASFALHGPEPTFAQGSPCTPGWVPTFGGQPGTNLWIDALAEFDDGSGPALYAGGRFLTASGTPASRIAKWDGSSWASLDVELGSGGVSALEVFDDGAGAALYAGGSFTRLDGAIVNRIAKWDGSSWSSLGSGMSEYSEVYALAVFDDGGGAALYAGGSFGTAGGEAGVQRIAKWNGAVWDRLADTGLNADVFALATFDDGGGPALYAGGVFTAAAGVAASGIARWDGASWSALGSGVVVAEGTEFSAVLALAARAESNQQTLHAGGTFGSAIDSGDSFLARWQGCPDSLPPALDCPAAVDVRDGLGTPSGEIVTFTVTATDNFDPAPSAVCVPPSGSLFPRGTTIVHCTATDALGNTSSCEFPINVWFKARRR